MMFGGDEGFEGFCFLLCILHIGSGRLSALFFIFIVPVKRKRLFSFVLNGGGMQRFKAEERKRARLSPLSLGYRV